MKRQLLWLIVILAFLLVLPINAQEMLNWMEYTENPVFGQSNSGPKAYYPSVCYDPNGFSKHGVTANYKMWYGTNSSAVGFANSDDGITWNDQGLVTGNVSYHCKVLYDPDGFGGTKYYYKMWYADPGIWPYDYRTIRYAESVKGLKWVHDQAITQDELQPLVTGSYEWWYGTYGPGAVIYNSKGYNVWHDNDPMGHKYVMYYNVAPMNCIPGETEATALAYSLDGKHWKRYGDQPVILSGPDGAWDSYFVYAWTVIKENDGYHMWYSGGHAASYEGIGYAVSPDGINWTAGSNNPVFHVNNGVVWRDVRTYTPSVIKVGNIYKMWFSGKESAESRYSIGYATTVAPQLNVHIDIMPNRCPNLLFIDHKDFIKVAILGAPDFNVKDVDAETIKLEGVDSKRWMIRDVSAPVVDPDNICDCSTDGPDGFNDLVLKFETRKLADVLGNVENGDEVILTLTGNLKDGARIDGRDCVIIESRQRKFAKSVSSDKLGKSISAIDGTLLENFRLFQNFPNPFNITTKISFQLPEPGIVNLSIYDIGGNLVETLVNEYKKSGFYSIDWNATKCESGIYLYKIESGKYISVKKCVFIK